MCILLHIYEGSSYFSPSYIMQPYLRCPYLRFPPRGINCHEIIAHDCCTHQHWLKRGAIDEINKKYILFDNIIDDLLSFVIYGGLIIIK